MGKYLDNTGLQVLWNKIKSVFLPKSGGTITGDLTVQGTSGIDCEYNVQASGFVHTNPTNTNDILLANGNTLPQSTFSLSGHTLSNDDGKAIAKSIADAVARAQEAYSYTDKLRNQFDAHTHQYLPLSGGTVNGDTTINGTLSNGDGMSTDGSLRVGGSSSFEGTATFYSTATFKGNAVMNGMLTVKGINLITGSKLSSDDDMLMLGSGSNAGYVVISDDMIGNTSPTQAGSNWCIELGGDAYFSSVSQSSDQRLKENIHDVDKSFTEKYWATENGLIHEYDWIKSKKHAIGMIAQELLNYIPEAVNYNVEADSYSVDYTSATCKMMGAMFQKIKELENEIVKMKQVIEKLKNN